MLFTGGILVFVLLVAAGNLCLGYATAVYLGVGADRFRGDQAPATEPAPSASNRRTAESDAQDPADHASPKEPDPPHEESPSERSIQGMKDGVMEHRDQLVQLDQRVRRCAAEPTTEAAQQCAADLADAGQQFLTAQQAALDELDDLDEESEPLAEARQQIQAVADKQATRLEESQANLDECELTDDNLAQYCATLLAETARQVEDCHEYRDTFDAALSGIAPCGDGGETAAHAANDAPSTASLHAAVKTALKHWENEDSRDRRPLSLGMINVDHCQQINERHGPLAGDRILQTTTDLVARLLKEEQVEVTQAAGQQFLMSLYDTNANDATSYLEQIRQTIEKTCFQFSGEDIRITVSCAVVEALRDDSAETILDRLTSTLQEAKRYGRNRTFLFEGEYPAPVVPPKLSIDEKTISI